MWSAQTCGCSWRRRGWTGWQSAPRWSCLPAPRSCTPWRRGSPPAGRGMAAQMGVNNAFLLTRECCHLRVYWMVFDAVITLNWEDNCKRLILWWFWKVLHITFNNLKNQKGCEAQLAHVYIITWPYYPWSLLTGHWYTCPSFHAGQYNFVTWGHHLNAQNAFLLHGHYTSTNPSYNQAAL